MGYGLPPEGAQAVAVDSHRPRGAAFEIIILTAFGRDGLGASVVDNWGRLLTNARMIAVKSGCAGGKSGG